MLLSIRVYAVNKFCPVIFNNIKFRESVQATAK